MGEVCIRWVGLGAHSLQCPAKVGCSDESQSGGWVHRSRLKAFDDLAQDCDAGMRIVVGYWWEQRRRDWLLLGGVGGVGHGFLPTGERVGAPVWVGLSDGSVSPAGGGGLLSWFGALKALGEAGSERRSAIPKHMFDVT